LKLVFAIVFSAYDRSPFLAQNTKRILTDVPWQSFQFGKTKLLLVLYQCFPTGGSCSTGRLSCGLTRGLCRRRPTRVTAGGNFLATDRRLVSRNDSRETRHTAIVLSYICITHCWFGFYCNTVNYANEVCDSAICLKELSYLFIWIIINKMRIVFSTNYFYS